MEADIGVIIWKPLNAKGSWYPWKAGEGHGTDSPRASSETINLPTLWYQTPESRTMKEQNSVVQSTLLAVISYRSCRRKTHPTLYPSKSPTILVCPSQYGSELYVKQLRKLNVWIEQSWKTMEQDAYFWVVRSQVELNYLLFSLSVFSFFITEEQFFRSEITAWNTLGQRRTMLHHPQR